MGKIGDGKEKKNTNKTLVEAQCFPLYSVLLAHGRTSIDYLSLDVEGHELKILKTVPWDKVEIKVSALMVNNKQLFTFYSCLLILYTCR